MKKVQQKNSEQAKLNNLVLKNELSTIALFLVLVFAIIAFGMSSFAWFANSSSVTASLSEISVKAFNFDITDVKYYQVSNISSNDYTYNDTEVTELRECNPDLLELNSMPLAIVVAISYNNNNEESVTLYAQGNNEFSTDENNYFSNVALVKSASLTSNKVVTASATAHSLTSKDVGTNSYIKNTDPVEIMTIASGSGTAYVIIEYNIDVIRFINEDRMASAPQDDSSVITYARDLSFVVR